MQDREESNKNNHQSETYCEISIFKFIQDYKNQLYLPKSFLSERDQKPSLLLKTRRGGKTLWDWLDLLIIPLFITLTAGGFTYYVSEKQNEISKQQNEISKQQNEISKQQNEISEQINKAEENRNQQALLLDYLDEISKLVENNELLSLNDDSETLRIIARARTLTVLKALDSDRKGELIQFLSAAKLIDANKTIIVLNKADLRNAKLNNVFLSQNNLSGVVLREANFLEADLREAILQKADLRGANLKKADLRGANLKKANLSGNSTNLSEALLIEAIIIRADLRGANLRGANLRGADLRGADLRGVNLSDVDSVRADFSDSNLSHSDLRNTNLKGVDLRGADLREVKNVKPSQIRLACNWDKAKLNDELREKVRQEKDPKLDCSQW